MADDATKLPEQAGMTAAGEPELADQQATWDESAQDESVPEDGGEREITSEDLAGEDQWVFLIDPAWQAADEDDEPPPEAVVGGWFVEEDGSTGYFLPNPDYQPSEPDLPTDPVDAVLQLVVRGEADGDELLEATKDVIFSVAVDEEGVAVVAPAPDDVPSVLATTAPRHRERVDAPGWMEVTIEELAAALPDEGVDVLLNPGAPASMRIIADVLKDFVADNENTAAGDLGEAADESAAAEPVAEGRAAGEAAGAARVSVVSEGAPTGQDAPGEDTQQAEGTGAQSTASATL